VWLPAWLPAAHDSGHRGALVVIATSGPSPGARTPPYVLLRPFPRRGTQAKNTAKVAAARELLTLVFYGMRDGHIRRASRPGQAA
jgi:hypothetical protein